MKLHPEAGALTIARGWRECAHPGLGSRRCRSLKDCFTLRRPGIGEAPFQGAGTFWRRTRGSLLRREPRATVTAPASGCIRICDQKFLMTV